MGGGPLRPTLFPSPSHAQVICEKADKTDIPTIDKKKYLVPSVRVFTLIFRSAVI
jgi:Autophagy protein Atg8 ubiquitin like